MIDRSRGVRGRQCCFSTRSAVKVTTGDRVGPGLPDVSGVSLAWLLSSRMPIEFG